MNATIDTERIKEAVNLINLAGRYTTLRRESAAEMAGPCPKCAGDDRFHVRSDWWACRQCHEKRGDAIEFVQWLGLAHSFPTACALLSGGALPVASGGPVTPKKRGRAGDAAPAPIDAQRIAKEATAAAWALLGSEGGPCRDYLTGRGLWPEAWESFGLGYALAGLPGTWDDQTRTRTAPKQPTICIPWAMKDGTVTAIRYRFLSSHTYTDADGRERTEKQTAQYGSDFAGRLFGGCALSGPGNVPALIICEGEINAMSVWQTTAGAVDVLSLGSEGQTLTPRAAFAIQEYRRVIVWVDKEEIARAALALLPGAVGFKSPYGKDANDWLQAGRLCEILERLVYGSTNE